MKRMARAVLNHLARTHGRYLSRGIARQTALDRHAGKTSAKHLAALAHNRFIAGNECNRTAIMPA